MRVGSALCLLVFVVSVAESRPSESESLSVSEDNVEVITTDSDEVITSTEYAEITTQTVTITDAFAAETTTTDDAALETTVSATATDDIKVVNSTGNVEVTSTTSVVEITTDFIDATTVTRGINLIKSAKNGEAEDFPRESAVKVTTEFTDLSGSTGGTALETTTAFEDEETTTWDISLVNSSRPVEIAYTTEFTDLAATIRDINLKTPGKNVELTSTPSTVEITTNFIDTTIVTRDINLHTSEQSVDVANTTDINPTVSEETATEFTDVVTTRTNRAINLLTSTESVEEASTGRTTTIAAVETTTVFSDVTHSSTDRGANLVTSTETVKGDRATHLNTTASVETTTDFPDVTTFRPSRAISLLTAIKNFKVSNTTAYAAVEPTTQYIDVTSSSGNFKETSTESSTNNTSGYIGERPGSHDLGIIFRRRHEPEPIINSSITLPCFITHARRGITPFIARPYDFDAELEAWSKKNLPTEIAFMNNDNSLYFVDLTKRPDTSGDGPTVKEYGDKVSLHLYTRHGKGSGLRLTLDVRQILKAGFNPIHPTKVIAHGFWSSIYSSSVQRIKDAYLRAGEYNVITIDWSSLVYGFYSSAREEVHGVGDYLGQFLRFLVYERLVDPQNLHLIGHSLGAHLVGFAGKRAHQDGWGIKRITGLDPALPYFTLSNHTGRLDSTDADVVDVIHTCANFLGMTSFLGDIDFYPNEGTNFQPGCNLDVFGICSHGRAVEYFSESISESTAFVGKFCDFERTDMIVKADNCPGEPVALMGEWLEFNQPGRYVLRTAASPPYGVGLDILYPAYLYKRARMLPINSTAG